MAFELIFGMLFRSANTYVPGPARSSAHDSEAFPERKALRAWLSSATDVRAGSRHVDASQRGGISSTNHELGRRPTFIEREEGIAGCDAPGLERLDAMVLRRKRTCA